MCARFIFLAVAVISTVFVLETFSAARGRSRKVHCSGVCNLKCSKTGPPIVGTCGYFQKCCKIAPSTECSKFGGTCKTIKMACGVTEALVNGGVCQTGLKCCKEKPLNPGFEGGAYKVVNGQAVFQKRFTAFAVKQRGKSVQKGYRRFIK